MLAAVPSDLLPGVMVLIAHSIGKAQIRRKNIKFSALLASHNRKISDAFVSIIRPEHRISLIYGLPVKPVFAQSKVNLLAVRRCLFPEMYK